MLWRMSKEQISRPPPKWAPRPLGKTQDVTKLSFDQ